jgi:hypothetical protein
MSTYAYIQQRNESNRKARAFLQDLLTEGPQTYQAVRQRAREAGVPLSGPDQGTQDTCGKKFPLTARPLGSIKKSTLISQNPRR